MTILNDEVTMSDEQIIKEVGNILIGHMTTLNGNKLFSTLADLINHKREGIEESLNIKKKRIGNYEKDLKDVKVQRDKYKQELAVLLNTQKAILPIESHDKVIPSPTLDLVSLVVDLPDVN